MLKNLLAFGQPKADTPEQFAAEVFKILERQFATEGFRLTSDPWVIAHDETEFGLQNLYSAYRLSKRGWRVLTEMVVEHFSNVLAQSKEVGLLDRLSWNEAIPYLKPQFMPAEYGDRIPVAFQPFAPSLHTALVLDLPKTYAYIRSEDLHRWGQEFDAALTIAAENLDDASHNLEAYSLPAPRRLLAIETKDGFDAARILAPGFRSFATQHLGSPFLVGIPNRDFLLMWAADVPEDFHNFNLDKVARDYETQPYPLSPLIFEATLDEVRPCTV